MRRLVTLFAFVSALALVASSCASSKDTGFPPTPTGTETGSEEPGEDTSTRDDPATLDGSPIAVVDSQFNPRYVLVEAGTEVVWAQTGLAPHTVTSDDARSDDPGPKAFDSHPDCGSTCMGQGDEFRFTFEEPGEYPYYCALHGAPGRTDDPNLMNGLIIVE